MKEGAQDTGKSDSALCNMQPRPPIPPATLSIVDAIAFLSVLWSYLSLDTRIKSQFTHSNRFKLNSAVIRVPIVPGSDPRMCYGDLVERGVRY